MKDQPDNPDQPDNLIAVQQQFRRQAEAYSTMKVVTDPRILDNIVEISEVRPDSRVLDVACGPGFVAMAFAPKCRSVLGIDATDKLVARARAETMRRGISNVAFALGNVERMPFAPASSTSPPAASRSIISPTRARSWPRWRACSNRARGW
jgi:ubiquinone/menaquinone biosynthesis C-methylase UbiE